MSTKPGIFEQVKQPGKIMASLNTNLKLSQLNVSGKISIWPKNLILIVI